MRIPIIVAALGGLATPAAAVTIDFNDLASDAFFKDAGNPYVSQGWQFANSATGEGPALIAWGRVGNAIVYNADANPSTGATLAHNKNMTVTTVSRIDGAAFTLASLQMADVFNGGGGQAGGGPVVFGFTTAAGSTSETRLFDLVRGLQTEIFNRSGLLSFTIAPQQFQPFNSFPVAGLIQFDNLGVAVDASVTAGVPEPASWAMLITGFGLTGAVMRRRRSFAVTA
jgi:hypothetical protein